MNTAKIDKARKLLTELKKANEPTVYMVACGEDDGKYTAVFCDHYENDKGVFDKPVYADSWEQLQERIDEVVKDSSPVVIGYKWNMPLQDVLDCLC